MTREQRQERLVAELEAMRALKKASSILDFESTGDPPQRYTVIYRGRGLKRDTSPKSDVEFLELHRVDVRLPYAYPNRAPDIRWVTPIFHPNISFSGFINLNDVGLPWANDLGLDVVCERLWDVARLAYMNLEHASNYAAKGWFEDEANMMALTLPVDHRPLRDKGAPSGTNIIRYERRDGQRVSLPTVEANEVLFIGEDTPTPQLPARATRRYQRPGQDDDDVLFIGD